MPKPFVKGDPRCNRKGRPKKGDSLTDFLSHALDQKKEMRIKDRSGKETGEIKTLLVRELIAERLISKAVNGDVQAMKYIFDRVDGSPIQTVKAGVTTADVSAADMTPEQRKQILNDFITKMSVADDP